MFRSLMLLGLAAFLFSNLAGCIVVDRHHSGGGKVPYGQAKKGHH